MMNIKVKEKWRYQMASKELPYFHIDGQFGGNQSWFLDPWMHIGGCGALTMCDFLLYEAVCCGRPECYPFDTGKLSKRDYRKFGMLMKPYLRPRETGIKDLKTFIDGASLYLEYNEIKGFELSAFDGDQPLESAWAKITGRLDADLPVPMLMLRHRDRKFDFFEWHWFLIVGYDMREDGGYIKVATYGKAHWLKFDDFWETGELERGGLILIND